jgi:ABC-type metal ion transport system substrate-binding protein
MIQTVKNSKVLQNFFEKKGTKQGLTLCIMEVKGYANIERK